MAIDEELITAMDHVSRGIRIVSDSLGHNYSDAEIRCLVVSSNIKALAEAMLQNEERGVPIPAKIYALGLLGTADWLKGDISIEKPVTE